MHSEVQESKPIFIVGCGRSGTTLALRILSNAAEVYAPSVETRFFVDPGGLFDLINDLSSNYSLTRAREALYRFENLMRFHLAEPNIKPYLGYDLPGQFGDDYWQALDELCGALCLFEFAGSDFPLPANESRVIKNVQQLLRTYRRLRGRAVPQRSAVARASIGEPRYFARREQLIDLVRHFVDTLFGGAMRREKKQRWCEKTPHSLLHLPFIWELYPQAQVIHMLRDPADVAMSFSRQNWASSDPAHAAQSVMQIYSAWLQKKTELALDASRYLEVKLEDLMQQPAQNLARLQQFLGLQQVFDPGLVKPQVRTKPMSDISADLAELRHELGYRDLMSE